MRSAAPATVSAKSMACPSSVSYTHLDVYKRQVKGVLGNQLPPYCLLEGAAQELDDLLDGGVSDQVCLCVMGSMLKYTEQKSPLL